MVVLAGIGGVWAVSSNQRGTTTPKPAATGALAVETYAAADFSGWTKKTPTDAATTFSVQSTGAKVGTVSLRIDSSTPASVADRQSLVTSATVAPNAAYTVSAWVKSGTTANTSAKITVGTSAAFTVPATGNAWKKISFPFSPGATTSAPVTISTSAPTRGVLIDGLDITPAAGGTSVLPVGSFEKYSSPTRITSTSLVLATGSSSLTVAAFGRSVEWTLTDQNGVQAAKGSQPTKAGVSTISMKGIPQGYYTVNAHPDVTGASAVSAPLMLLDKPAKGRKATDVRFGIGVHMRSANDAGSAPLVAKLGFGSVRDDANWGTVETAPGVYTYPDAFTKGYAEYAKDGVEVLPIAAYWNKFYDIGRTPSSPAGIAAYAKYASAFAAHFSSPAIEIYNEPNGFANGKCGKTPECYLPLLKGAYEQLKADNPKTVVVGPAIAYQDDAWLGTFYAAGGLNYLDAVSFHPYGGQIAPEYLAINIPRGIAAIKDHNGGKSKPLWITELGFTTNTTGNGVSERVQGDYSVRAQALSLASGAERYYNYDLVNEGLDVTDHEGNFGLFRAPTASVSAFLPKPGAMAQAVLIRELSGKKFASRDSLGEASYSYAFGAGNTATRVAWSAAPTTVSYATKSPVTLVTEYGNKTTLTPSNGHVTVQLSGEPVYVEGAITGSTAAASTASISASTPTVSQGAAPRVTLSVAASKASGSQSTVFTIDGKKYEVKSVDGKATKKTVSLPPSSAPGPRTISATVGSDGKANSYLTASISVVAPAK
ncbi:glycosyl hydrolase [Lacisediminihabitans sp.]|uniref:glycosyl hydrolase n=1 Tax=Lacisediminihabitans sp. TaxID=2787631 RepID=UPI00374DB21C